MRGNEIGNLLTGLVKIPSLSGREGDAALFLSGWLRERGVDEDLDDSALRVLVSGKEDGNTLLLASHLDTVPPGEGWTVDPYEGLVRDGCLFGRGSVDAKASIAAMAWAVQQCASKNLIKKGRLVFLATFSEETKETTMPIALERLGFVVDGAIIGEPTGLNACIAQRGLLIVDLIWKGEQRHAGRPGINSILLAADDLARLRELPLDREDELLGPISVTPTMIQAGLKRNMTPGKCVCTLDVRTTPAYTHEEIIDKLKEGLNAEVDVISTRLRPARTPLGSALLNACMTAGAGEPFASPTTSDWVWLRDKDAVKLGPGESSFSHGPDEQIDLDEVSRAGGLYLEIIKEYLK